ncbi:MAG: Tm-1-like ATP-binding domain-containing protein [Oscillospiraceae bacterium]|jgi:uncharacterized protein (UPF0261 family)
MNRKRILVLGTLDTKGEEFAFLKEELLSRGCDPIVMDLGLLGKPAFEPDITCSAVLQRAGATLEEFQDGASRGRAIDAIILGGKRMVQELYREKRFDGIIAMGGGSGTTIGMQIMRELPLGVPKVQVTTLADLANFIGESDICVVRSMVDMLGLNSLTRLVIQEAASAITGLTEYRADQSVLRPCVAITCLGVTTPGVMKLRERLIRMGKEVIVLHFSTSIVDQLVESGMLEAIVDMTPSEITRSIIYPDTKGNPKRLLSAREAGIPILFAPGALDMLLYPHPISDIPSHLRDRQHVVHSPNMTLLATTKKERELLAEYLIRQLNASKGPAAVLLPIGGFSMWDVPGRAFHDAEAIAAFRTAVYATASSQIRVVETQANINDDEFADQAAELVHFLLTEK